MRLRFDTSLLGSAGALILLVLAAGCSGGSVLEPDRDSTIEGGVPLAAVAAVEEVCTTIDFESYAHGDPIPSIAVPELELNFNVTAWPSNGGLASARVYDTDTMAPPGDPFLAWAGAGSTCPACLGAGNVLVFEDGAGFDSGGASDFGGTFFLDGFSQPDVRIRRITAVGAGSYDDSHYMLIDAEPLASSNASAGDLQTLTPTAEPVIQSFVELVVLSSAQGGFDDLMLCRMMEVPEEPGGSQGGGEGCGFSYWRNPQHIQSWTGTGLSPESNLAGVFGGAPSTLAKPEQALAPAELTLSTSLGLRGSGVNRLLRESVAAMLNAETDGVDYDLTPEQVIELYSIAIAGGDVGGTTKTLKHYNNQVCPLD